MTTRQEMNKIFELIRNVPKWSKFDTSTNNLDLWYKYFRLCPYNILRQTIAELVTEIKWRPDLSDVYGKAKSKCGGIWPSEVTAKSTSDDSKESLRYMKEQGQVPVYNPDLTYTKEWRDKSECIRFKGKYIRKIEYVMEVLGSEYVNTILKKGLGIGTATTKEIFSGALRDYPALLETLIAEAQDKLKEPEHVEGDFF